jgi:hypothetical protein
MISRKATAMTIFMPPIFSRIADRPDRRRDHRVRESAIRPGLESRSAGAPPAFQSSTS